MKRKLSLRRCAALALTAGLGLAGLLFGPKASAADVTINTSGFKDIGDYTDHIYIYQWKEGLPPYNWSKTYGKKFPTLITWDDTYYFKVTTNVALNMRDNIHAYTSALKDGWSTDNSDCGVGNGSFNDNKNGYPHGNYYMDMMYYGNLLSDLDEVDFSLLNADSNVVSLALPKGIPNLIPVFPVNGGGENGGAKNDSYSLIHANYNRYSIEVDLPDSWLWYDHDYVGNFDDDGGFRQGENYLIGVRKDDCTHKVIDNPWYIGDDYYQYNGFRWSLYALNDTTARNCTNNNWFDSVSFSYNDYLTGAKNHQYNSNGWPHYFSWYALERTENGKKYQGFWTLGAYFHVKDFYIDSHVGGYKDCQKLTSSYPQIALAHKGDKFETCGDREGDMVYSFYFHASEWLGALKKKYSFRCWYAEPLLASIIRQDFTVEEGQISNLDGPIIIDKATITVKDGGTLVINNWVMNNGKIEVEEGGTLYLSDNACLNKTSDSYETYGSIRSNGLIIVGEGAKLIGGGWNGIELHDGSHVVNYGCVAAEQFVVASDYTIENRENGFVLTGPGNAIAGAGSAAFNTPLDYTNKTFAERTTCYSDPFLQLPDNCIYHD